VDNPLHRLRRKPAGSRPFSVTVLSPERAKIVEAASLPEDAAWDECVSALCGALGLPADAQAYRLLDVKGGRWLEWPATVGEVEPRRIGLVHRDLAAPNDDAAVIAEIVRSTAPGGG
jgi:hypothetical protein